MIIDILVQLMICYICCTMGSSAKLRRYDVVKTVDGQICLRQSEASQHQSSDQEELIGSGSSLNDELNRLRPSFHDNDEQKWHDEII